MENVTSSSSRVTESSESNRKSVSVEAVTPDTLTGTSKRDIPLFNPELDADKVRDVIAQFFNISNPCDDDIMFLLFLRRDGLHEAKRVAQSFGWKCEMAVRSVERMML
jgi:hypothetical protein